MDPKNASSEGLLAFLREFYPEVYAVVPREIVSRENPESSSVEASPRSCPSESGRSSPAHSEASRMEAESATESSSEVTDDDGFETVVSKKRKGKRVKTSLPVKRASLASPTRPVRAKTAASPVTSQAPMTSSAPAAPEARKVKPPPPVILQDNPYPEARVRLRSFSEPVIAALSIEDGLTSPPPPTGYAVKAYKANS
ncbi:unnamed protein product, partial [Brenthis ino]